MPAETFHILLAEDNWAIADVLRFNLEKAGCRVTVAPDGRAACEAMGNDQFDAIVSDYQMPHASGEDVFRHACQDERHENTPLFLCSAKGLELDTSRMREELGVVEVFFKPFSPRQVVQSVLAALEMVGATD